MPTVNVHLTRSQKIAFSRIVSDLIEADFIVDEGEMNSFEHIISADGFRISKEMLVEGKKMNFAKAVETLRDLSSDERRKLFNVLKSLSLSDDCCVPLEAIQLFAIEQVLVMNQRLYAVPARWTNLRNMQVVYIENDFDEAINHTIWQNYAAISSRLAQAGFTFVYIPHITNDFKRLRSGYLQKVVRYMIPSATDDRVRDICRKLCGMTTKQFCRDLLYKKIGLNLIDAQPSLLIKVSDSYLINPYGQDDMERTVYGNFLKMALSDGFLPTIEAMLKAYTRLVNHPEPASSAIETDKFYYHGFHRSLFDLIAFGREREECRLIFDFTLLRPAVYFQSVDEPTSKPHPLKLNPQETTLFLLIATRSVHGEGLLWSEEATEEARKEALAAYNAIYSRVSRGNTTHYYKDRAQVHHIRTKIKALTSLANADMFCPYNYKNEEGKSFYRIKAKEDYLMVKGLDIAQ